MVDAAAERGVSSAAYIEIGGGGGGEMEYSTEPMLRPEGLETNFWEGPSGTLSTSSWLPARLSTFSSGWLLVELWWLHTTKGPYQANPVYKGSIQSKELLEEPEASNSHVFKANPTDDAPNLE